MVTKRSVSLFLSGLVLFTLFHPGAVGARASAVDPGTIAVGLLSAFDKKPMASAGPFLPGGHLSVTLVPLEGAVSQQVLSGDLFLALDTVAVAAGEPSSDQGAASGPDHPFSVQAGSYGNEEAARRFAGEIRGHWPDIDVRVAQAQLDDGRTAHRVMAGRFHDRQRALAFTATLAAYGMDGAFVVHTGPGRTGQGGGVEGTRPLILYNSSTGLVGGLLRVTVRGVPPGPEGQGAPSPSFRLDGEPYRGDLELRGGDEGIIAVNRVALEDYLLGVVPCELGPDRFPLLEALKAQAVAARTYALKHAGRHRGEGFDLCDTPHCQVYGGAGREKALSSEAVRQTAGLAAFYQGRLAETLYTSTCGGHTEISSAVFSGPAEPYLGGVTCVTDHHAKPLDIPPHLVRRGAKVIEAESRTGLGFALELLILLDILRPGEVSEKDAGRAITLAEAEKWIGKIGLRYRGGPVMTRGEDPAPGPPATRCELAFIICHALAWDQRLETLFSNDDLPDLVGGTVRGTANQQRALALLLTTGIFKLMPDGRAAADETVSRGRFASALARLAMHLEPGLLEEGVIAGAAQGRLRLRFGVAVEPREIAPQGLLLFERRGPGTRPIDVQRLRTGDRVLVHHDLHGRVDLLVRRPAAEGTAADRYSPYAYWSIVVDRESIEGLLEENGHLLGRLIDLRPLERGPGGRLTSLKVIGSTGTAVLRGLDIRWNLSTRENLFFIDRLSSAEGVNRGYRFTGRGWGHGVGMCQVGAAGLAESGAGFIEILEHYYPGVRIETAAGGAGGPQAAPGGRNDF